MRRALVLEYSAPGDCPRSAIGYAGRVELRSSPGVPVLHPQQLFADRYRIVRPLATGGMGAVFIAQHTATEGLVALKVLWPHVMEHERARQNFELEAKVAARVRSDHIVKVLDAGLDASTGAPFLVMELLEGATLAERVTRDGPRPWPEVLEWMSQTARGLDAAHGHRNASGALEPIVHRDLKPENLFLTTGSNGAPLVKILDFGIAKVLSESTHLSREVRGTPRYMAYEQVAGEHLSPRTDVWALGLITYFLLTGRCYWRSSDRLEALFAEILNLPQPAPSRRAREDGVAAEFLAPGFDGWLLCCIDRNPSARFASAGEAVQALVALEPPAKLESARTSAEAAQVSARTETVSEGLRIAAITQSSVPTLTTALPDHSVPLPRTRRARRGLVAAAVVLAGIGATWLLLGRQSSAPERATATTEAPAARAVASALTLPSPEPPRAPPTAPPLAIVSQSDSTVEPAPAAPKPRAPATSRTKRTATPPAPATSERPAAAPATRRPPIFVELPRDPPSPLPPSNQ